MGLLKHVDRLTTYRVSDYLLLDEATQRNLEIVASLSGRGEADGHVYDHLEEALERAVFDLSLKHCQGNQVKTSELLGVSRNTLRDRMKKFGLF